jgi:isoleucyl-tRNA synthetase
MSMNQHFKPVDPKPNFPKQEDEVLKFWQKNKIFEQSVEQRPKDKPYTFYDGPPFVTGYPHYGHLIGSIAKDIIPRYFTMKGKRVRRVWGWDCHGLPIENKVEEKIGLKNRKEIEKYGINKFIKECRVYVDSVSIEWKWYIDKIARWVDMDNAYKTMDLSYMESVIWVFKQLYDKGLIYKGIRTSLFCTRCGTPISNFEIAMDNSYTLMEDPAVTVKFELTKLPKKLYQYKDKNVYALAWTTTPWTLPSNRALAVDKNESYIMVEVKDKEKDGLYILADKRKKTVLKNLEYQILEKLNGSDLIGLSYKPPYTFVKPNSNDLNIYFYPDMVNMEEGTGIVHSAPGFGEIDTQMGRDLGLTIMLTVDDEGKFKKEVTLFKNIYVKAADQEIMKDLNSKNLLFKQEKIQHRYPYCYRCSTPLIHKAQESWFISVKDLKSKLLQTNKKINWVPHYIKNGRFKKGIEQAPDWCISRTRYWATIMPIWECDQCDERIVFGSIKDIEAMSNQKITDLHRNGVDNITFSCKKCQGTMRRIPEVLDCWMESGSMPYGERHYPFENKKDFENSFPADFIVEYTGQVRAWFYVMHVISNALKNSHCFKNVVVTGVMAGTDGRKMSKSYGNYPDPKEILNKYGGDALRLYLLTSPVMIGQNVKMTKGDEIEDQVKKVLLILWNTYRYFITYANAHKFDINKAVNLKTNHSKHILDKYIVSKLNLFIKNFSQRLERYNIPHGVKLIQPFITELSTWYLRNSRSRFVGSDVKAFQTLYYVLYNFCKAVAPVMPFITESIYQNLKTKEGKQSIHLADYPEFNDKLIDLSLHQDMEAVKDLVSRGHHQRKQEQIRLRQPLQKLIIKSNSLQKQLKEKKQLIQLIKEELNVKEVIFRPGKKLIIKLDMKLTAKLKQEGEARELIRKIQSARKKAGLKMNQKATAQAPGWPKQYEQEIKNKAMLRELKKGSSIKILT